VELYSGNHKQLSMCKVYAFGDDALLRFGQLSDVDKLDNIVKRSGMKTASL